MRWFGFRMVGETTWASSGDRSMRAAVLPSTIRTRCARLVPRLSSGATAGGTIFATAGTDAAPADSTRASPALRGDTCVKSLSCATTTTSHVMSAMPREVAANPRSMATASGRWRVITSRAYRAARCSGGPISTVVDTAFEVNPPACLPLHGETAPALPRAASCRSAAPGMTDDESGCGWSTR